MEIPDLQVRMLGGFSIRLGGKEINDSDNRSRKVWLLMAYMIYCRNRSISQEELADLLWGEEERSSNPINALKTMFHRVRSLLNQLDSAAGHSLIVRQEGTYAWNQEVPFSLDTDDFEALCRKGASEEDEEARLETDLQALALYGGDFLPKLSAEPWVVPIRLLPQFIHPDRPGGPSPAGGPRPPGGGSGAVPQECGGGALQ